MSRSRYGSLMCQFSEDAKFIIQVLHLQHPAECLEHSAELLCILHNFRVTEYKLDQSPFLRRQSSVKFPFSMIEKNQRNVETVCGQGAGSNFSFTDGNTEVQDLTGDILLPVQHTFNSVTLSRFAGNSSLASLQVLRLSTGSWLLSSHLCPALVPPS